MKITKTIIVGHRGAAGYAPENTLLSFQKAIDLGCDRTEFDVRLSKDNVAVVIHDERVDRVTNGNGFVADLTLEEIKKLYCPENQKIPTVQEVIDLCKGKIDLQVELKAQGTPNVINKLIVKNNIISHVLVTSFDINLIKEIKEINREIKVGYLFETFPPNIWKISKEIPLEYICPKSTIINKKKIEIAHSLGMKVYVFHVQDKILGDKLIELGVDDIGTNYPKLFINS